MQPVLKAGSEYFLNLNFTLKKDELWAKTGYVVATEQLAIPYIVPAKVKPEVASYFPVQVEEKDDMVKISGNEFQVTFNKKAGTITQLVYNNLKIMDTRKEAVYGVRQETGLISWDTITTARIAGPKVNVFRAPADNDFIFGGGPGPIWQKQGLAHLKDKVTGFKIEKSKDNQVKVVIDIESKAPKGYTVKSSFTYNIQPDGQIDVTVNMDPQQVDWLLPKLGVILELPAGFEDITWFGAGPHENYSDRKTSAAIGLYHKTVDEMTEDYIRPQEMGNRSDTRWFAMSNRQGRGVKFTCDTPLNFSALHHLPIDLDRANHPYQLVHRPETIITIDAVQNGLGGGSCGPGPMEQYKLKSENVSFGFTIAPYEGGPIN